MYGSPERQKGVKVGTLTFRNTESIKHKVDLLKIIYVPAKINLQTCNTYKMTINHRNSSSIFTRSIKYSVSISKRKFSLLTRFEKFHSLPVQRLKTPINFPNTIQIRYTLDRGVFIKRSAIDFGRDDRRAKARRIIKALEIITRHWKYRKCPDTPEETGWSEFNGGEQRWTTRSRWHGLPPYLLRSENPKELEAARFLDAVELHYYSPISHD